MAEVHTQIAERLQQNGQRYTPTRRRLIEIIHSAGRPLTLPDIVSTAPDLAQSSAYRNLDVLAQSGIIDRIVTGGDHHCFELAEAIVGHHHHLICDDCGAVEDIELPDSFEASVDKILASVAKAHGFTTTGHTFDARGLCASCFSDHDAGEGLGGASR